MFSIVPEVHLFICLDPALSPGPVLQSLDYIRAQNWEKETVLVCDSSWKHYVNIDQPVLYLDRAHFFSSPGDRLNGDALDSFLEELDRFEISKVTQVGQLQWGRWIKAYIDTLDNVDYHNLGAQGEVTSSIQLMNELAESLSFDLSLPIFENSKSSEIYIDPYDGDMISQTFLELIQSWDEPKLPDWLRVITREQDIESLKQYNIEDSLVDVSETEMSLFNQCVLCFSDKSPFALTSRSYNIALFSCETKSSLFVQGDISIVPKTSIHMSELLNILVYWKAKRLKELAFQWLNMGIEVETLEFFHNRLVSRNILNYSSDLYHCQMILDEFMRCDGKVTKRSIHDLIKRMKQTVDNDPYSLSFSLKILLMITERMMTSAQCGERLFQRLGSDYHRLIIGEALIEKVMELEGSNITDNDVKKRLKSFLNYLIEIDFINDEISTTTAQKESR